MIKVFMRYFVIFFVIFCTGGASIVYAAEKVAEKNTTILKAPKDIVVLDPTVLDNMLLLNVKPIAYAGNLPTYLKAKIPNAIDVGQENHLSFIKMFYLMPDLIIGDSSDNGKIDKQLQKIAPTMLLAGKDGSIDDQIDALKVLGITFKKEKKADDIIAHFNHLLKQSETLGQAYPSAVLMLKIEKNGTLMAASQDSFASNLLKRLGKDNLIEAKGDSTPWVNISLTDMVKLNPEQIILLAGNATKEAVNSVLLSSKWQSLRAVKYHRVYDMNENYWVDVRGIFALEEALKEANQTGFLSLKQAS